MRSMVPFSVAVVVPFGRDALLVRRGVGRFVVVERFVVVVLAAAQPVPCARCAVLPHGDPDDTRLRGAVEGVARHIEVVSARVGDRFVEFGDDISAPAAQRDVESPGEPLFGVCDGLFGRRDRPVAESGVGAVDELSRCGSVLRDGGGRFLDLDRRGLLARVAGGRRCGQQKQAGVFSHALVFLWCVSFRRARTLRRNPVLAGAFAPPGQKYAFFRDCPPCCPGKRLPLHKYRNYGGFLHSGGSGDDASAARCLRGADAAALCGAGGPLGGCAGADRALAFGGDVRGLAGRCGGRGADARVVRRAFGPQGLDRGCRGRCLGPRGGRGRGPRARRSGTCRT